jgi:hypothetical protein
MFNGLPFTYRRSVLAEVANAKKFSLANIICVDPNLPVRLHLLLEIVELLY